jgi:hypothetical protein
MAEAGFTLEDDALALPPGAIARTHRRYLRRDGRTVLGLTQGRMRPYLYPLLTPAGHLASSESPADHPHHNSLWIAADHVNALVPTAPGKHEDYTYNFYVDETFQGRAAGSLLAGPAELASTRAERATIRQQVEWRGPVEWAAAGRTVAREVREITVCAAPRAWTIDVVSELSPAQWDLSLGPTRHAYFNARVSDAMVVALGGRVRDDRGHSGGDAIGTLGATWVAFEGPVGGGYTAGIAVIPDPADAADLSWFVADWGVVSVGTFRLAARRIARGSALRTRCRFVVYDGHATDGDIAGWQDGFRIP